MIFVVVLDTSLLLCVAVGPSTWSVPATIMFTFTPSVWQHTVYFCRPLFYVCCHLLSLVAANLLCFYFKPVKSLSDYFWLLSFRISAVAIVTCLSEVNTVTLSNVIDMVIESCSDTEQCYWHGDWELLTLSLHSHSWQTSSWLYRVAWVDDDTGRHVALC